jgi:phosphatidylserine synthase
LGKVASNRTSEWTAEGPKQNYILTYVIVLSIVLQFLAGLQIIRHKVKSMKNASEEDRSVFRRQLKSIAAGSFIFIAVASVVRWLSLKINQVQFYVMKTTLWSNLQFTPK